MLEHYSPRPKKRVVRQAELNSESLIESYLFEINQPAVLLAELSSELLLELHLLVPILRVELSAAHRTLRWPVPQQGH
jgi:hypothetical protein